MPSLMTVITQKNGTKDMPDKVIYENASYKIVVGLPPKTVEFPEPFEVYLVINKDTGVLETFHQVLPYAKNWADQFDAYLRGVDADTEKVVDPQAEYIFKSRLN